jgi:hypothetical protein
MQRDEDFQARDRFDPPSEGQSIASPLLLARVRPLQAGVFEVDKELIFSD